jgi:hypothetical protein
MRNANLIIIFVLLISCKPVDRGLFEFNPSTLVLDEIMLADIVDDMEYIPLESKYPLGLIYDKIVPVNNSIYLSALRVGVLVFNMEGKLQRKIGSIGRGPGEYATCYSFAIDENNETIYILDIGNIVKVYSRTGRFLRSFQLNEYGAMIKTIEFFDARLFVSYGLESVDSKYEWIAVDTSGNVIKKKERTVPGFITGYNGLGYSYKFDNTLSFYNDYTDTVFSILPDLTQKPSFIIAPGKHRLPKSTTSSLEEFSTYMLLQQIFETDQFIIIRYYYSFPVSKFAFVLTDKKSHKSFLTFLESDGDYIIEYSGGIKNDFDGGPAFLPRNYFKMNGREYLVGFQNPYRIINHVKSKEFRNLTSRFPEKKIELDNLANILKETDNPVLVLVRLKK